MLRRSLYFLSLLNLNMEIKGLKNIKDFDYLIMFDLASRVSGVCVWDIHLQKPHSIYKIIVDKEKVELPVAELYNKIDLLFSELGKEIDLSKVFVSKEAMPTQVHGGNSTIQTFLALAKSHAILDYYTFTHNIPVYDYTGVYPISTHAYLKKLLEKDKDYKIQKTDIRDYVCDKYDLQVETLDESDAVFLAQTLIEFKWNKDLDELIRERKRHRKTLKLSSAIKKVDEEITKLENLRLTINS